MSTENIYPTEYPLENGFSLILGHETISNAKSIRALFLKLNDDVALRKFFIDNTYAELVNHCEDKEVFHLLDFVQKSKIVPVATMEKKATPFFNYIMVLADKANTLFRNHLNRELSDICEKANDVGILSISSYIDNVDDRKKDAVFDVITSPDKCKPVQYFRDNEVLPRVCFYNISDELNEIWIKNENKGLFLELWLYHALKSFFDDDPHLNVYHGVKVKKYYTEQAKDVDELVEEAEEEEEISFDEFENDTANDITDIDVLICKDGEPFCAIECKRKNESNVGMADVLKLKGVMSLLNIDMGVLFTKKFRHELHDSQILNNIFVISKVLDDEKSWLKVCEIIQST